jgi:chemotaxis-related protein WspD
VSEAIFQTLAPAKITGNGACWNEIGVYGQQTCPELKSFVHCRNCPVYSTAGVKLLERELPVQYRQERTGHYAVQKHYREPSRSSVVVFRVGTEWLALPTWLLQEVAEHRPIHSVPHRRNGMVLGLANIRGELLLCLTLTHLLGVKETGGQDQVRNGYYRLLVVNWQDISAAFPVQEVVGPQRIHPEALKAPPATLVHARHSFVRSVFYWENRAVGLLDPERILAALNRNLA